jgi:hypothetical protein
MTDLATTFGPKQDTSAGRTPATSPARSTVEPTTLITEQQVRFSTAAAIALPPAKTRGFGDAIGELAAKVRAVFAASEKPQAKRYYARRYDFIESAAMSREMDRL